MPRTSLAPASFHVLAALLALAAGACGKTGLDTPVDVTGTAGTMAVASPSGTAGTVGTAGMVGTAGVFGSAGTTGAAGVFGSAGTTGAAGVFGSAGTTGAAGVFGSAGTTGAAGIFGSAGTTGAAGTAPATCVEGANTCADAHTVAVCSGDLVLTFTCPMGCVRGVCAECVPGSTTCEGDESMQVCGPSGVWQPAQTCDGLCVDGACETCVEGTTQCISSAAQQTCKGGIWTATMGCEFVCVGDACGQRVRHVFATSMAFVPGELGGLSGADDICRKLAVGSGLSSSYAAWLSDDTGSPASRFPEDVGPYVLVDGSVVANNWSDLTSGVLRHPIDLDESGGPPAPSTALITDKAIWTNTAPDGTRSSVFAAGGSCGDWSDPQGTNVVLGSTDFANKGWSELLGVSSDAATHVCGTASAALYCFEQ